MLKGQFDTNLLSEPNMISLTKRKDLLINKHKELNKRLYVFTKNSRYTTKLQSPVKSMERKRQLDKESAASIKEYNRIVLPKIKGDEGLKPHKSAYMIQKERIDKSKKVVIREKNEKAKEIHEESNLLKINTMIIHHKSIECNKAKKKLIDIRMFVGRNTKDYYMTMKKKYVDSKVKYELLDLEDKNKVKQKEIDSIMKSRVFTV